MTAEISLRLTAERERIGYSKSDFARKIGVTRETLRLWEMGQGVPSTEALLNSRQFGVDIAYVLTGVRSTAAPRETFGHVRQSGVSGVGVATGNVQIINTSKHITRTVAEVKPGDEHISDAQAASLQELVAKVATLELTVSRSPRTQRAIWSALNKHCGVPKYRLIAHDDFDKARTYLHKWIGRLDSMPSAKKAVNADWRNRKYAYIKINTREPAEAEAFAAYLEKSRLPSSLSSLTDAQLEAAYGYVAGRKKRGARL